METTQTEHTPTPWELIENVSGSFIARDGKQVGRILKLDDAAFIVRAVNSYDPLMTAMRRIFGLVDGEIESNTYFEMCEEIKVIAEKVIAQAEGK